MMAAGGTRVLAGFNIWAMDKDPRIKHLLLLLAEQLDRNRLAVDERIGTDKQALYLCDSDDGELRAYLFTLAQRPGQYGVHLEYPQSSAANPVFDVFENLSLGALVDLLAIHFDIDDIHPLPVLH